MSIRQRFRLSDKNEMSRITSNIYLRSPCPKNFLTFKRCVTTPFAFLFIVALLLICYNEIFVYEWSRLYWPEIESLAKKPTVEKLLLIADPQLIGEKDEGFFGAITRIDADRYLAKTFSLANDFVRPDWTLFLGDIFDEGLSANDEEFKRYFERFDEIFQFENRGQRCLVVPGDNDVGGEYYGDKQPVLRQRFRNYFGRMVALFRQNDIEFLKLDVDMIESYLDGKQNEIQAELENRPMSSIFRIVLNHWPILSRSTRFVKPFVNEVEPNLILKGDSHYFHILAFDRQNFSNRLLARDRFPETILSFDLNDRRLIYEISVPTCSYRMGVARMGYGVLLLDSETKTAHFALLSTPRRYLSLYFYAAYGVLFFFTLIITSLFSRRTIFRIFSFR